MTKNINYSFFSHTKFETLAKIKSPHCVSLFVPTYRGGKEVDQGKSQIMLKNNLKEATEKLIAQGMKESETSDYLRPVELLLEDVQFWRNQSDGLAIYLDRGRMHKFPLPIHFEQQTYVADHFYLLPLIPLFNGDGKYFLLSLTQDDVKLYEANRHSIGEIDLKGLIPGQLEDAVGYDYKERALQYHSAGSAVKYHGQGSVKDTRKSDLMQYFRGVNRGIQLEIGDENAPLLVASPDQHFSMYQEVNTYKNLYPANLSGNPEGKDMFLLHELSWDLMKPHFSSHKQKMYQKIQANRKKQTVTTDLNEALNAAHEGRVDTLFLNMDKEQFGVYDEVNRNVLKDEQKSSENTSFFNELAIQTFEQGGHVYLAKNDTIPLASQKVAALLRY